jgi:hypothetical protein
MRFSKNWTSFSRAQFGFQNFEIVAGWRELRSNFLISVASHTSYYRPKHHIWSIWTVMQGAHTGKMLKKHQSSVSIPGHLQGFTRCYFVCSLLLVLSDGKWSCVYAMCMHCICSLSALYMHCICNVYMLCHKSSTTCIFAREKYLHFFLLICSYSQLGSFSVFFSADPFLLTLGVVSGFKKNLFLSQST